MPPVDVPDVLFVSKPLSPPWDDSGKLLPYLLAQRAGGLRLAVMTPRGQPLDLPGVTCEPLYAAPRSFTVPMADKLRVMGRILFRATPPLVHFFFSPNTATTMAVRAFRKAHPDVRVVQTVMSLPDNPDQLASGVFADVLISWSKAGASQAAQVVRQRGLPTQVVHIPPGILPLPPMSREERRRVRDELGLPPDRPLVLFAGDLEYSTAAMVAAETALLLKDRSPATFVFACRPKTPASRLVRADLEKMLAGPIGAGTAFVLGTVPRFADLLRSADCQILPTDTTYAKTDLPLVVLEGLSAGVPAIVGTGTPMDELIEAGAVVGVPPLMPHLLADAILGLVGGRGRGDVLGAHGRAYVMKRHTADAMAEAHVRLYRNLLAGKGPG